MTSRCFDGLFTDIIVDTTHKKKKGIWSVETEYIFAEGKTEKEAVKNLIRELRYLADALEDTLLDEESKSR